MKIGRCGLDLKSCCSRVQPRGRQPGVIYKDEPSPTELEARVTRFANAWRTWGGRDDKVAVMLNNCRSYHHFFACSYLGAVAVR